MHELLNKKRVSIIFNSFHNCCFSRSSSGFEMLVCSSDGTVAFFQFEQNEMGDPMTNEEKVCENVVI